MYAHQVISDVSNNAIADDIAKAVKYHFGDIGKTVHAPLKPMYENYEATTGKRFKVFNTYSEDVTSPYKTVWFDWHNTDIEGIMGVPKHGVLLFKSPSNIDSKYDYLVGYHFYYTRLKKRWDISNIVFSVDLAISEIKIHTLDNEWQISTPELQEFQELSCRYAVICTNACLLFLNCRNVETCEQRPPRKLQKKRKKKNKTPMFTYQILKIKSTRKRSNSTGVGGNTKEVTQRYHHVPARVVYYTKEKPLFGKPYKGCYGRIYFKDYWKGNPDKGIIIKDYETEGKEAKS